MKSSTAFTLAALLALSAAAPFEKRDMLTVIDVVNIVETVDVTTTIFVPPGDPRLVAQQAAMKPQAPAAVPAQTTSAAVAYIAPHTSVVATSKTPPAVPQMQQKEAVQAAPAPFSAPAAAPAKPAAIAAAPAVEKVAPAAQPHAAPVQQSSPPVASPSTPSTSSSSSGATGAACGDEGGACVASDVTTFTDGLGTCGTDDLTIYGDNFFALAHEMMGPGSSIGDKPANPYCGRTAEITYNGKTVTGTLADKCMACTGASLDLSPALFASLFDGATTGRYHEISWKFTNGPQPIA